jgi:hypothetical protein
LIQLKHTGEAADNRRELRVNGEYMIVPAGLPRRIAAPERL